MHIHASACQVCGYIFSQACGGARGKPWFCPECGRIVCCRCFYEHNVSKCKRRMCAHCLASKGGSGNFKCKICGLYGSWRTIHDLYHR